MKILAVSDIVLPQMETSSYLQRTYDGIEMVISCGDMPAPYIEYIASVLSAPLFFVRGNHDMNYADGFPGGENLHLKTVRYRGLWLAGLEGSMMYNGQPCQYTDTQMAQMVIGMAPGMLWRRRRNGYGVDILVTHSPPLGIHDAEDKPHRGFRAMRWAIQWYRPRFLIHGHIDVNDRRKTIETQVGATTVLNINPVKLLTVEVAKSAR